MILAGLWALNIIIVAFALPVLAFANLRYFFRRRTSEFGLSKPVHP